MDLNLYKNFSVPNKIEKNITLVTSFQGQQLVLPADDHEISVRIVAGDVTWDNVNYFSWDGAYYFLESVEHGPGGAVLHGSMDLLMTFKTAIRGLRIQGGRSTAHGSPRLADGSRLVSADGERIVTAWPTVISGEEADGLYVLTTSQGSYS